MIDIAGDMHGDAYRRLSLFYTIWRKLHIREDKTLRQVNICMALFIVTLLVPSGSGMMLAVFLAELQSS